MADYTLSAKITGDASGFTKAFQSANSTLEELSNKTKAAGEKINSFGKKLSMTGAGITAGITTPFLGAVKMTADFDSAMRKAGAIAGASATELKAMTQAALDLGASTSLSSSEVANAMTEMAAKGFDANQVIGAMPGVISAAEASGEDLALVADIMSSSLNAFSLEASQSGKVADILAMTANKTAAGIGDMSYAFKYAAAPASSLGISMEELSAATGLMVNAGLDGSSAGTTLRASFTQLASPTKQASELMSDLGFSAVDANGNFKPLNQIVGELNKSMSGMTETQKLAALSTIFGTEAASGMLILLKQGQDGLKGLTKELENSSGASAAAAEQMKAGIGGALDNLSGAIESATISVMSQLTPLITKIAKFVTSLVEKFNGLDDGTKKIIAFAAGIAALAGPVLTVLGIMAMGIGGLGSALAFLISPVGLVVAGIVALVAIFGIAMAKSESFRNTVMSVFESLKGGVSSFASGFGEKLLTVFETVKSVITTVAGVIDQFVSSIVSGFSSAGGQVSSLSALFLGFNPIMKIAMMVLTQFGPQLAAGFSQIASGVMPLLTTLGTALGQLAASILPVVANAFGSIIPVIMQVGLILMSTIMTILPIIINLFNNLVPIIMMVVQQFAQIIAVVIPLVANLVSALLPAISMIIQTVMNVVTAVAPAFIAIIGAIGAAIQVLLPIISSIIQIIIHVVTNIISVITPIIGFISMVISTIIGIIAPIITFIAGVMTSIFAAIRPVVTVVTGVFDTVFQVISSVWQGVTRFTGQIFTSIGTIISGLSSVVSGVFNAISGIISRIMDGVSNKITGVFDNIRKAWSGLTSFVGGIFDGISGAVSKLVGQVKGFVNGVIGGVNSAIGIINKIPGVSIGAIPYLARGTENFGGGFARINEGGRGELVYMPNGTQVIPHDVSMRYAREAAKTSSNSQSGGQVSLARVETLLENIFYAGKTIANKDQSIILDGREIARATSPHLNSINTMNAMRSRKFGGDPLA